MDNRAIKRFYDLYPNDEACRAYVESVRWPNGPVCPHCGSQDQSYRFKDGKLLKCKGCRQQYSAKAGTIFADSHVALRDWFFAVYALSHSDTGLSSAALADYIGTTQKTAWSITKRLRDELEPGTSPKGTREKPYRIRLSFEDALKKIATANKSQTQKE